MPFNVPSLRRLIRDGEQDIATELDVQALPPVGVERAINTAVSSQVRDLYDHQMWIKDQIIPTPKSDDATIVDTAATEGVIRKLATFATGPAVFKGAAPLPAGTEMQSAGSLIYVVTGAGVSINGVITVEVQSEDTGYGANLAEGEPLTLLSPVAGVDSSGMSGNGGISGGTDIESIAELLDRLLYRKRSPPVGGALHDYVNWAREMPGVTRAWVWDCWHGPATVGLAWVYDNRPSGIAPTYTDRNAMEAWLFRHPDPATGISVGKPGGIEVWPLMLTLRVTGMSIHLSPDTPATRAATRDSLTRLYRSLSPGQTLLVSALRTAIGTSSGVKDYTLSITQDIPAGAQELITMGNITWLTP
ncbi:TPA: baseplate J/gp47 family protein [Citrobacter amalonaticus]